LFSAPILVVLFYPANIKLKMWKVIAVR